MGYVLNRGTKDRPKWYGGFKDLDGKWKQKHTKQPNKAGAMRIVAEWEARVGRSLVGVPEPGSPDAQRAEMTVRDLVEKYLTEYSRPRIQNIETYRRKARSTLNQRIAPYPIAAMPAISVRRADVEALRDQLRGVGYANGSINQALIMLHTAYGWAFDREIIDCRNPVKGVEFMPETPSQDHFSRDEVARLLDPVRRRPMVATALYTGMRKGELFGLTWERVRLDLGHIDVVQAVKPDGKLGPTKTGKPRTIPIHRELAPILEAWRDECPKSCGGFVFPVRAPATSPAALGFEGRAARARRPPAGGEGWRMGHAEDMEDIHDVLAEAGCHLAGRPWYAMRHTFATFFVESGGSIQAQEMIMGHSPGRRRNPITAGYTHVGMEYLAREMGKLSFALPVGAGEGTAHRNPDIRPAEVRTGDLLTSMEVAVLLGYHRRSGVEAFKTFRARHHDLNSLAQRIGKRLFWRRADVEGWMLRHPRHAPPGRAQETAPVGE